ncbi:MAG: hypothetical protein KDF59_10185 [Nitrosomonas sp.]|nr:hypothetical protein [Nitrosomonas sp.]
MNNEPSTKATSQPPTEEELFYLEWGKETVKSNINIATDVLKQFIAINVVLLGGGAAFLEGSDISVLSRSVILISFLLGLIVSIIGVVPKESKVDFRVPKQIKAHKSKALMKKRCFLYLSAAFTVFGLLMAALVAIGVKLCF